MLLDFIYFCPIFFFCISLLFILIVSSFLVFSRGINAWEFVPDLCFISLVLCLFLFYTIGSDTNAIIFNFHFYMNFFNYVIVLFIGVLGLVLFGFLKYFCTVAKINALEPYILLGILLVGCFSAVLANDLFGLYLSLEVVTIVSFILACLQRFASLATEASLKYFILGAMSSGLLLFGITLVYGFTGLSNFSDFKILFTSGFTCFSLEWFLCFTGLIFILAGLLFKLSVAPFHMWLPDVLDGIAPPVVFLFSTITKIVIAVSLVNLLWVVFYIFYFFWNFLFFFLGVLSVIWGSIAGLLQVRLYRILAYSAVVNGGFFIIMLSSGTIDGLVAFVNYVAVYSCTFVAFFSIIFNIRIWDMEWRTFVIYLDELFLMAKSYRLESFFFALIFFSLLGLPPLAGFYAKFYFFYALFGEGFYFYFLMIMLLCTILSAIYYIRCIHYLFFKTSSGDVKVIRKSRLNTHFVLFVSELINLYFVYVPVLLSALYGLMWSFL